VETGKIQFSPKSWEKTYFEWMYNIRDWCISRQLWWGHQIPAWYCADCENITVSRETPKQCSGCKGSKLTQDEDVLDTWFSSGLWPFSTLGWPDKTKALGTFYPTSILETGFDIIFFWVARMIMMGIHFIGDVPFRKVYLHAMVRDEKGEKMSKSKGNVIDPLLLIDQHGADPLRFTLTSMAGQGRDIKLSVDRVEGYRAFCNKLWNATKFLHLQFEADQGGPVAEPSGGCEAWLRANRNELTPVNCWILSRVQSVCTEVEGGFERFELNTSAQALYEFAWLELCDWFIEFSKRPLREGGEARLQTIYTLHYVLEKLLRLMHPITPFVTEELWQSLPWKAAANTPARKRDGKAELITLMFQAFPKADPLFADRSSEVLVDRMRSVVEAVRNFRGENNLSPKQEFDVRYVAADDWAESFMREHSADLVALTRVKGLTAVKETAADDEAIIPLGSPAVELRISLKGLVDTDAETARLRKEIDKVNADIQFIRNKLGKESFIAKAPPELVAKEKAREAELVAKLAELDSAMTRLSRLK
jgi:valyl-tRNA synthetase